MILETNASAREILRRCEGLKDRDGVLSGAVGADETDVRLGALLATALPRRGRQAVGGSSGADRLLSRCRDVAREPIVPTRISAVTSSENTQIWG